MRVTFGLVFALLLASCVRFDLFTCADDSECVLNGLAGRCEASGYCSFPNPDCAQGFGYSAHAPADLANECVPGGGDGTGTTTTGEPMETGSGSESESGMVPACVDNDGDGFGEGDACDGPDCDDDNANASDGCLYIAPDGDDANPGTRAAPWRTFLYAFNQLAPGDSLVALDGSYDTDDHGSVRPICEGIANGTAAEPIFVRAENDRQAVIDRHGHAAGVGAFDCTYWRFRGFAIIGSDESTDAGGREDQPIAIGDSSQLEFRQIFASHTNRYFNEHAVEMGNSTDILFEDVEVHDYFRMGFSFYRSDRITCRRCYGASHSSPDLPQCPDTPACDDETMPELIGGAECPFCSSGSDQRGDTTFYVQHANDILFENCISDGAYRGFQLGGGTGIDGGPAGRGIRILQSMSIDDDFAIVAYTDAPLTGIVVEDFVAISPRSIGVDFDNPDGHAVTNLTVLEPGSKGVRIRAGDPTQCTSGACSVSFHNVLILGAGEVGFEVQDAMDTWSLANSNVFGSTDVDYSYPDLAGDPFDDGDGHARFNLNEEAMGVGLDSCQLYIPRQGNLAGAGAEGADIGANVVDLLVDGEATDASIWADDGNFPCGPDPAQPPQIAGQQCPDVSARTNVGSDACPLP